MTLGHQPLRRAEYITPPNTLKLKAGSGGLDEKIIEKAQKMMEDSDIDFLPYAQRYLNGLQEGIRMCQTKRGQFDDEALIVTMIYPAMQMKANGGMFGYPLITAVAARLVRFLEHLHEPNEDAMDIVNGFYNTLQAILLMGEKTDKVAEHGAELYGALDDACERFYARYRRD